MRAFPTLIFLGVSFVLLRGVDPLLQIPAGTETVATVPCFNLWTLAHNADQIFRGGDYWNGRIFYPFESTFVLSEAQPNLLILSPVSAIVSPVFAYNVYVYFSLTMNGVAGFLFARRNLHCSPSSATSNGVLLQLLPFVNLQLGVLQLIAIWPSLLFFHFLNRFVESGEKTNAAGTGLFFGVTYLCCNNYGLMAAIVGALVFGPTFLLSRNFFNRLPGIALAILCSFFLTAPVVLEQLSVLGTPEFKRSADTVAGLSAQLGDLLVSPWKDRLSIPGLASLRDRPLWGLSGGLIPYVLAVGGVIIGLQEPKLRRWTIILVAISLVSAILSIVPGEGSLGKSWHLLLCKVIPGLSQIRSVYRFVVYFQIAVVCLAAIFLSGCERRMVQSTSWFKGKLPVGAAFSVCLALCCTLEVFPDSTYVCTPPWQVDQPFCKWLREHCGQEDAILCLPFQPGTETSDYEQEVAWMMAGRFHQRPIVNGYSGFFPADYLAVRREATLPLNASTVRRLKSIGVRFLSVKRDWIATTGKASLNEQIPDAEFVFNDAVNDVWIYQLL
ncbi:MAG: hypothetical protein U0936_05845 [Planctomycetaceae bacterium]